MKPGITALLSELHQGGQDAARVLMPLVYAQLHEIASALFARERAGHTLQPTDILHETYLRLIKPGTGPWTSRQHFFAIASRAMRQILVDHARAHGAIKRGGRLRRIDLEKVIVVAPRGSGWILDLDDALKRLAKLSRRQSRIVELRFFGGLTVREVATVLGVGATTVKEDWMLAKAWLQRELGP